MPMFQAPMISAFPAPGYSSTPKIFRLMGRVFTAFDPEGKAVFINSDGVGTKTEFYERSGKHWLALYDSLAMNGTTASRTAARIMVTNDVVER